MRRRLRIERSNQNRLSREGVKVLLGLFQVTCFRAVEEGRFRSLDVKNMIPHSFKTASCPRSRAGRDFEGVAVKFKGTLVEAVPVGDELSPGPKDKGRWGRFPKQFGEQLIAGELFAPRILGPGNMKAAAPCVIGVDDEAEPLEARMFEPMIATGKGDDLSL